MLPNHWPIQRKLDYAAGGIRGNGIDDNTNNNNNNNSDNNDNIQPKQHVNVRSFYSTVDLDHEMLHANTNNRINQKVIIDNNNNESNEQNMDNTEQTNNIGSSTATATTTATRTTTTETVKGELNDLIELVPFDVQIAVTTNDGIQIFEVSDIVTEWMNEAYQLQLNEYGYTPENNYASFEAIVLLKRQETNEDHQRRLITSTTSQQQQQHLDHFPLTEIMNVHNEVIVIGMESSELDTEQSNMQQQQKQQQILSVSIQPNYHSGLRKVALGRVLQGDESNNNNNSNENKNDETSSSSSSSQFYGGDLFTAKFKGGAYFVRPDNNTKPIPEHDVLVIQQMTFYNTSSLLERLQLSQTLGLGSAVVDVKAFLNPSAEYNDNRTSDDNASSNNHGYTADELEIVIIAAIGIAVLAFLFLLAAIYWAYRYDKKNQDAYQVDGTNSNGHNNKRSNTKKKKKNKKNTLGEKAEVTSNDSSKTESRQTNTPPKTIYQGHPYPMVIGGSVIGDPVYPESVISDSIVDDQQSVLTTDDPILLNNSYLVLHERRNSTDPVDVDEISASLSSYHQYTVPEQEISIPADVDDEVSASLSYYYRSGMGKVGGGGGVHNTMATSSDDVSDIGITTTTTGNHFLLNDAASVSSMESYCYSLDGTIPTVVSKNRVGGGGTKSTSTGSDNHSNNNRMNSYTAHLARIGGLPVEPDLRQIEHLTIDDISGVYDSESASETVSSSSQPKNSTTTTTTKR